MKTLILTASLALTLATSATAIASTKDGAIPPGVTVTGAEVLQAEPLRLSIAGAPFKDADFKDLADVAKVTPTWKVLKVEPKAILAKVYLVSKEGKGAAVTMHVSAELAKSIKLSKGDVVSAEVSVRGAMGLVTLKKGTIPLGFIASEGTAVTTEK